MQLRHITLDPNDGKARITDDSKLLAKRYGDSGCNEILFDVDGLLNTATTLFRGFCPKSTPYFIFDELYPLPWMKKYYRVDKDNFIALEINEAVATIVDELRSAASTECLEFPAKIPAVTFSQNSYKTDQQQVQGLLVEALLAFDELIEMLTQNKPYDAMQWLSAGYKFLMEAIHQAWPIAEKSQIARWKAELSHKEDHAMQQDVFKWLDINMTNCKTMDDAALAMAEKLVYAKFGTVRKWVGQWKKLGSAGRG